MSKQLLRRGLLLEYATLGWNVVGVVLLALAAWRSDSVALFGFGLDSLLEIGASAVVVWELSGEGKARRQRALRLIGMAFLLLAVYVGMMSGRALLLGLHPGISPLGMIWLALTCAVMLVLAWGKRRVGTLLNNPVLLTESRVTLVDALLAASVLAGLALNAAQGWWWADPLAGLIIVFYGFKEGVHAFKEAT